MYLHSFSEIHGLLSPKKKKNMNFKIMSKISDHELRLSTDINSLSLSHVPPTPPFPPLFQKKKKTTKIT